MKKPFWGVFAFITALLIITAIYSNSRIKRDVPILLVKKDINASSDIVQAEILSYEEICEGIIYDINNSNDKILVALAMQTDPQTGLSSDKQYMSTNLYDVKTSQMKLFNFDLTDHVSACFDENMLGVYYLSMDKNQDRAIMYTTIDNNKTKIIAGKEEKITTGIIRAGKYVIYGTNDGKIKIADSKDYKKIIYEMGDKYTVKKIRYFVKSQICIVQAENKNNNQNPLFMIDTANGDMRLIDINVIDFDTDENGYSVVYITKIGQDENQIYLYDITSNARKFEKSGLIENVFFNKSGDAIAYIEKTKTEATVFNIGLIIKNGKKNIRIISDIKLSNKKLVFVDDYIIYFSEMTSKTAELNTTPIHEYKIKKIVFSLLDEIK